MSRLSPLTPLYVSLFAFTAGESALHVLVPPYLSEELGAAPASIGVVVAAFGIAALVARLPAGALYSRSRSGLLLVAGGSVSALAFALVPLAGDVVGVSMLMALDGLGFSVVTTTQLALLVALRPSSRPLASTIGWYAGFVAAGHAVAGVLAGVLADQIGFDAAFYAFAAVPALATALGLYAVARAGGDSGVPLHRSPFRLRHVASLPALVWSGALVLFTTNVLFIAVTTFQPVLVLGAGLTLTEIGILASCRSWSSSISRLGSGPAFARVRAERLTVPLLLLGAAAVAVLPTVKASFLLQIPLSVAMGLSRGLLRVTGSTQAFGALDADERRHGLTSGVLNAGLDLGRVVGPLAAGLVAQAVGLSTMFRVLPLAALGLYFGFDLVSRRLDTARAASRAA